MDQFCAVLKLDLAHNFKFSIIRRFRASTLSDDSYRVHNMLIVSRYGVIMFEQKKKAGHYETGLGGWQGMFSAGWHIRRYSFIPEIFKLDEWHIN